MKRDDDGVVCDDIAAKRSRGDAYFDQVPDYLIAEIAKWMMMKTPDHTLSDVANLLRFSETCKRIFRVINESEFAFDVWSTVDIAALVREKSEDPDDEDMIQEMTELMISVPRIRLFQNLSLIHGLANGNILGLVISMPNLRKLSVELNEAAACSDSVKRAIRQEHQKKFEGMIDSRRILESIESLENLRYLRLATDWRHKSVDLVPIKFPSTLRDLRLKGVDASELCRGTFESIKSLTLEDCDGDLTRVFRTFPAITSLSIACHGRPLMKEDPQKIWEMCTRLEEISIKSEPTIFLSLESFERSECSKNIRKFSLNNSSVEETVWCTVIRSCPNLVEICMTNPKPTPADIKNLATLKKLRVLQMDFKNESEDYSTAFSELGKSVDAAPLSKLVLQSAHKIDLREFFSSRRCHQLREIAFYECSFHKDCIASLVDNLRGGSLKHVHLFFCDDSSRQLMEVAESYRDICVEFTTH